MESSNVIDRLTGTLELSGLRLEYATMRLTVQGFFALYPPPDPDPEVVAWHDELSRMGKQLGAIRRFIEPELLREIGSFLHETRAIGPGTLE